MYIKCNKKLDQINWRKKGSNFYTPRIIMIKRCVIVANLTQGGTKKEMNTC